MEIPEEEVKKYAEVVRRNQGPIQNSKIFLNLLSEGSFKEVVPVVQMGLAVLMDKPIVLLVKKNTKVPEHLKKIAVAIRYLETDSTEEMEAKVKELLNAVGLSKGENP